MFSNLVKAKLPLLKVCFSRKLLPLPPSRPSFKLAILLLLAGDVSLKNHPAAKRTCLGRTSVGQQ